MVGERPIEVNRKILYLSQLRSIFALFSPYLEV
jgi:hypothetical protein